MIPITTDYTLRY